MRNILLSIFLLSYIFSYSQLSVIVSYSTPSCINSCNGVASVQANGGSSPYTYDWGGMSTSPDIWGLCTGTYTVLVTDQLGDTASVSVFINSISPIFATMVVTEDTCGLCNGTATVTNVSGGAGAYTYTWNTTPVQNTQTVTNLCSGTYSCTISDMGGCMWQFTGTINPAVGGSGSCQYGLVSGSVYHDIDTDCAQDSTEQGLENIIIMATPGPYYASTNTNGNYSMVLPFDNYTITQILPANFNEICPISGSYSFTLDSLNNTFTNIDFADSISPVQDVSVQLTSGAARPGFYYTYYLNYTSINSIPMNGVVSLVYDANILSYTNSSIAPNLISGDTLFWDYSNLQQFENRAISATFYIPANVNLLGDTLQACAQITPVIGDVNVVNNTTCHDRIITGAYDPNDKRVSPEGDILLSDNELKYTIRFQNTGSDTAFTVVVVDTLSANLDVTSIRNIIASHPFEYGISEQGILTFTFANILLPDSNVNEPASHGLIEFTINQHPSNTIGTEIENTAEIYFDFNPAIVTNTVVNTIVLPTNIDENKHPNTVSVYPNPTNGSLRVSFNTTDENEVSIVLFDITGRKVNEFIQNKSMNGNQVLDLNLSDVKSGIYFLTIKTGDKSYTNKIVVRKD